jgi:photosystem II stability/assembly factor-like uncharacterized protein
MRPHSRRQRGASAVFGDMKKTLLGGVLTSITLCMCAMVSAPVAAQEAWVNVTGSLAFKLSECGNMTLLSAVPGSDRLIAGVAARGLWESTAEGKWTQIGTGAGSERVTHRPSSIVYDPQDPAIFWVSGIYNTVGLYQTKDGGQTFQRLGSVSHNDSVSVDFTDPERRTLLAGSHELGHTVNKSSDGGKTWENVGTTLPPNSGHTTYPFVIDAATLLVNTAGAVNEAGGIFRSTDAGLSWQRVSTFGPYSGLLRASSGVLYWAANGRMLRSTNHGLTWTATGASLLSVRPVELPDKRIVAVGENTLMISADGGSTWTALGGRLPYAPNGLVYSPQRKGFYIWRGDCGEQVPRDAVMKLEFDSAAASGGSL